MQNEALFDLIKESESSGFYLKVKDRENYYRAKRIIDFLIALTLLVILSPVMLIEAILIFIYSPGPVFFVQDRVGAKRVSHNKNCYWERRNFHIYKFRTMKINADPAIHKAYIQALIQNDEEKMNALQEAPTRPHKYSEQSNTSQNAPTRPRKLVNDSRIIRPGVILRKFSLDELPQLWNVLRGDLSLVGPRPAIPYEVEMYKPWHLQRLEAQPGITGLQQITARCNIDFDEQVKLDIEYIDKQSLWYDIEIMLKTPFAVISTKGAY